MTGKKNHRHIPWLSTVNQPFVKRFFKILGIGILIQKQADVFFWEAVTVFACQEIIKPACIVGWAFQVRNLRIFILSDADHQCQPAKTIGGFCRTDIA